VKEHIEHFASSSEDGIAFGCWRGFGDAEAEGLPAAQGEGAEESAGKNEEDPAAKTEEIEALSKEKRALERLFRDIGELPLFNLLTTRA
jgi:hypothetical protein